MKNAQKNEKKKNLVRKNALRLANLSQNEKCK